MSMVTRLEEEEEEEKGEDGKERRRGDGGMPEVVVQKTARVVDEARRRVDALLVGHCWSVPPIPIYRHLDNR
jgi:hypothetical protein